MPTDCSDIENCLNSLGLEYRHSMTPRNIVRRLRPELNPFRSDINIFPLEWFDNEPDLKCIPARNEGLAFLPDLSKSTPQSSEIKADDFEWSKVTVEKYNEEANKWRIKELESGAIYDVPRIYLMFSVEEPLAFAKRIQRALQLRSECETRLRFEALVDGIALSEIPNPSARIQESIRKLLFRPFATGWIEIFEHEHSLLYRKTIAAMELRHFVELNPIRFPSIQLPDLIERSRNPRLLVSSALYGKEVHQRRQLRETFEKSKQTLRKTTLSCCPGAIKIMEFINEECEAVTQFSSFPYRDNTSGVFSLNEFAMDNLKKLLEFSNFFEKKWLEDVLVGELRRQLVGIGRGWFDPEVNDWYVYKASKLCRLIEFVKHRMELAVHAMLRSSLGAFVNRFCQPCEMCNIEVDFVWGNDLLKSRFSSHQPIFIIKLGLDAKGEPKYSEDPETFAREIVKTFKSLVQATQKVPHIDSYIIRKLKFDRKLQLSSLKLDDGEIQSQIQYIEQCYSNCEIPLRAFARELDRFKLFWNLFIPEYVQAFKLNESQTARELKKEISFQLDSIEEIQRTVPSTIVIGPFQVDIQELKEELQAKRRALHDELMELLIEKLMEKLHAINEDYKEIVARLSKKSETIEELVEVRQWLPQIPSEVARIHNQRINLSPDFDVLEEFLVVLPEETFSIKYSSMMMPQEIEQKVHNAQQRHHFEFEQFEKLQMMHEAKFFAQIESLAADVEVQLDLRDFDDLSRISFGIDEAWSALNDLVARGELLNSRRRIFSHPEIEMERVDVLIERLRPNHALLTWPSNFMRSRDEWFLAPLPSVDINRVKEEVERCWNILQDSRLHFSSDLEMMVLIERISKILEEFSTTTIPVMEALINPDFHAEQWNILSERTGGLIRYSPEITFSALLERGILACAKIAMELSSEATHERKANELIELQKLKKKELALQKKNRLAAKMHIFD